MTERAESPEADAAPTAIVGEPPPAFVARFDKLFRTAMVVIPLGVLGNVAFSLLSTDRALLGSLARFPRGYLLLALALGILPWFTNALRMLIWIRFLGHSVTYLDALRIALATDLGAAVSPAAVGGNFFKWGMLVQRGVSPGAAASLSTLTPIEDGVFFALAIPLSLLATASWRSPVFASIGAQLQEKAFIVLGVSLAIAVGSWLVVRSVLGGKLGVHVQRRGRRFAGRFRRSLRGTWVDAREVYRLIRTNGKARFALSLSLTGIQWISRYSIITVLIAFLGAPVQPVLFWVLQWVVFTIAAFIPTPGAAGAAEAAFFLVYSPFVPAEIIGLATAGWRFFTFYLLLALAAILYFILARVRD
jgi:uncharacterized protein (TIRG00374 family)